MSEKAFFQQEAHERTAEVVAEVEGHTSAEVVVAVRRTSGYYRHADYLFGLVVGLGTLCALLFLPQEFALWTFPVDVAVGFVLGAVVSAHLDPLRRLLTRPERRQDNARRAARAAFWELGISRTTGRTGILVFFSMFERRVEVVRDIGVDIQPIAEEWHTAMQALQSAADRRDFERFIEALRALGPMLGKVLERSEDDVNELADGVNAA